MSVTETIRERYEENEEERNHDGLGSDHVTGENTRIGTRERALPAVANLVCISSDSMRVSRGNRRNPFFVHHKDL